MTRIRPNLTQASLSAAYAPIGAARPGNRFVFLGDSITLGGDLGAGDGTDPTPATIQRSDSWPIFASVLSEGRIRYVSNEGIAGNTTTQMLARIDADVIARTPHTAVVSGGTNDITQAIPFATYRANIEEMVSRLRVAGIVPVLGNIPPRDDSAALIATTAKWNAWLAQYAANEGITLIDFQSALVNPVDGHYQASLTLGDGLHPNAAGYYAMGQEVHAVLTALLPDVQPYLVANDADTNNMLTGGMFGTDTDANGIGNGWSAYATPTGGTYSRTRVTDAAVLGTMQRVTVTGTTGGLNGVKQDITLASGKFAVGDRLRFSCVFTRSGVNGEVWILPTGSTGTTNFKPIKAARDITRAVLEADFVVPPGTTSLTVALVTTASGTGYAEFGRVGLYNLTQLGLV